jgi:ATP-binding cassette subfamily B protein
MGFYEGLNEEKYDRTYKDSLLTRRIVEYFTAQRRQVAIIVVVTVILAVIGASQPVLISYGLDRLQAIPTLAASLAIGGIVLLIGVADWGLNVVRRRLTARTVGDVVLRLRALSFTAAVEHDLSFYDQFSSGRVV